MIPKKSVMLIRAIIGRTASMPASAPPASAKALLLLASALLSQHAQCSESSCVAGPMTITKATCSTAAMDGFNCGVIVSEIACALMNYNGDVIETPNLPAIIHSDEVGDKIVIITKVEDAAITINSDRNDLGDDNELKTLQVLTPPSSPPLAPLPPSPPPLPPNDPGLPKGCAVVPVVAENPPNTGDNNAIVGSSSFYIDRMPCSWEGHGPISLEVGDGEYVDFGKV